MFKHIKNFLQNNKAQVTVQGIMAFFVLTILVLTITPVLSDMIVNATSGANQTIDGPVEITIVRLIPLFIYIGLIGSFFMYVTPRYEQ